MKCIRCMWLVLLCLAWVMPAEAAQTNVNKIAAVVNGEMITLHELRIFTTAEMNRRRIRANDPRADEIQAEVLDSMINDMLMRQEAKRYKVSVSDVEVTKEYDRMMTRSGMSKTQFEADLRNQGMSPELVRRQVGNTLLRQRFSHFMVSRKVFVTPEEVRAYYDTHKSEMVKPKTASFSIMLLPQNVNAQQIYNQLKSGTTTFEETAKNYSLDSAASEGGNVRDVPWDRLPQQMQKLLASLQPGGLSPIMRSQEGFVIIRLDEISEARSLTFTEAEPRVKEILLTPLLEERFKELVTQLRSKAVIDIRI